MALTKQQTRNVVRRALRSRGENAAGLANAVSADTKAVIVLWPNDQVDTVISSAAALSEEPGVRLEFPTLRDVVEAILQKTDSKD